MGPGTEAGAFKRPAEQLQGLRTNRFRPVESNAPGAQVELLDLFFGRFLRGELVGEIGAATDRGPVFRNGLEPAHGALKESGGRHEHGLGADVDRMQQAADQAHVVVRRQPDDTTVVLSRAKSLLDQSRVVQQIGVGKHHALGRTGRAGGVLQESQAVLVDLRRYPLIFQTFLQIVGHEKLCDGKLGQAVEHLAHARHNAARSHGNNSARVIHDRLDARQPAVVAGRVSWNSHDSSVQTTEESSHVGWSRRVQQHGPLAAQTELSEPHGDPARPGVELSKGGALALGLPIRQKDVSRAFPLRFRSPAEQVDQSANRRFFHLATFHRVVLRSCSAQPVSQASASASSAQSAIRMMSWYRPSKKHSSRSSPSTLNPSSLFSLMLRMLVSRVLT